MSQQQQQQQHQLEFVTLDVFSRNPYEGNPLAVVLIPVNTDPPSEVLQKIAREFNLSETVFIYLNNDASGQWRIRIFMTEHELPFAGHPTIGAAVYAMQNLVGKSSSNSSDSGAGRGSNSDHRLGAQPRKGTFICNAGSIQVDFDVPSAVANASIPHNVHLHSQPVTMEDVLALQPSLKDTQPLSMQTVSPVRGMNFMCVELPNLQALAKLQTTGVKPSPRLDNGWDVGFTGSLFFVRTGQRELRTRMIEGLLEDPATGSASCGLAAFLALKDRTDSVATYKITQGVEMGRRSEIEVTVVLANDLSAVSDIILKGTAVRVMQGTLCW